MELNLRDEQKTVWLPAPSEMEAGGHVETTLSLRSIVEACFRHKRQFVLVAALVAAFTATALLLIPKRYQASMQLVVLNARQYNVVTSDADQPNKQLAEITDNDVNSQAELLRSHDVLEAALSQLGYAGAGTAARDKAIEGITQRLDVAPVRQSAVMNVTYTDASPEKARQTLQAIANSFVAKELVLLRPSVGRGVFDGLVTDAGTKLAAAQTRFADFKVSHDIASLAQDETGLVQQVREAGTQFDALGSELAAERHRLQSTEQQLGRHPERIVTVTKSVPNGQAVQELSAKLVELQNKRTALLTGYLPTDRFVQEVDQQIATTRQALTQLQAANASEQTTDVNPLHQELAADLTRSSIASVALAAKQQAVDAERKAYLARLNQLEQHGAEYEGLQHEVAEAQTNYDTAVHKRDAGAVEDALDRDRILNVAFAAKPSADSVPIQPKPKLYVALGLFAALFFAVGSCAVTEMSRDTVYTPAELDALTGVMTVATVPLGHPSKIGSSRPARSTEPKANGVMDPVEPAMQAYFARSAKG